jgi:small subunit ribosomal protein S9
MAATPTAIKGSNDILGIGRRKTSVARIRLREGTGAITINGRAFDEYFCTLRQQNAVVAPLVQTGKREQFDVIIRVVGGGITGQADACKLGIARALRKISEEFVGPLRESGLLTRDSRMKERKKYGLRGARRGTQFSKR